MPLPIFAAPTNPPARPETLNGTKAASRLGFNGPTADESTLRWWRCNPGRVLATRAAWVLAVAVLTLGCEAPDDGKATETDVTSSPSTPANDPAADAVADLATHLNVEAAAIEVIAEEAVTWSDGSRGCAKEGFGYTQSLVEGSRITLRADGADYEYHAGDVEPPFLCEKPSQ